MRQVRQKLQFDANTNKNGSCRGTGEKQKCEEFEDLCRIDSDYEDFHGAIKCHPADPEEAMTPRNSSVKSIYMSNPDHSVQARESLYSCATPKSAIKRRGININPFTSESILIQTVGAKRSRRRISRKDSCQDSSESEFEDEFIPPLKRKSVKVIPTSRYTSEFYEVEKISSGKFGDVFKCVKRLDGCIYAIKRFKRSLTASVEEQNILREVYAHAVLGRHPHVVRYYSAWMEDEQVLIQNEYCDGGTLEEVITDNQRTLKHHSESQLKDLLLQVSRGLKFIHSAALAHMDIKPSSIFISRQAAVHDAEVSGLGADVVYKIGQLGHVTHLSSPKVKKESRGFVAKEILHENYRNLPKADIFALALTVLYTCGAKVLLRNGEEWQRIYRGKLPAVAQVLSEELHQLLTLMLHPDPMCRPSSASLSKHPVLQPSSKASVDILREQLREQKFRNSMLMKELNKIQSPTEPSFSDSSNTMNYCSENKDYKSSRLVRKSLHRSLSLTM